MNFERYYKEHLTEKDFRNELSGININILLTILMIIINLFAYSPIDDAFGFLLGIFPLWGFGIIGTEIEAIHKPAIKRIFTKSKCESIYVWMLIIYGVNLFLIIAWYLLLWSINYPNLCYIPNTKTILFIFAGISALFACMIGIIKIIVVDSCMKNQNMFATPKVSEQSYMWDNYLKDYTLQANWELKINNLLDKVFGDSIASKEPYLLQLDLLLNTLDDYPDNKALSEELTELENNLNKILHTQEQLTEQQRKNIEAQLKEAREQQIAQVRKDIASAKDNITKISDQFIRIYNNEIDKEIAKANLTNVQKAAVYATNELLKIHPYSKAKLITCLIQKGFDRETARKAVNSMDIDWNEQAKLSTLLYLKNNNISDTELMRLLKQDGFLTDEAKYALSQCQIKTTNANTDSSVDAIIYDITIMID